MGRVAVYPGTFDPVTNGHIDLMERSLRLFDKVCVGVFDNLAKSVLFSNAERIEMIRKATSHLRGIEVEASDFGRFSEVLPRLAREHDVRLLEVTPTDESLESVFAYLVSA